MSTLKKIVSWSLDLVLPKYCIGCGKENFYVCESCLNRILILLNTGCFLCGRRSPTGHVCKRCKNKFHSALNGLLVSSDWNDLFLRQIIYKYKYNFVKELADPLAQIMIKFLEANHFKNLLSANTILIPVPLHKKRLIWRGFNQAELLAQRISQHFFIPLDTGVLERSRHTLPQVMIKNQNNRRKNTKGVFKTTAKISDNFTGLKNKTVILIDDVCTTSSTLEECARILKPLKPKEIWGLVIARG